MPRAARAALPAIPSISDRRGARRLRRLGAATVLVLLATMLGAVASPAQALEIRSFSKVFSTNTNGDILIAANTLMTCSTTSGANAGSCAAARDATSGSSKNNDFNSQFVDVDSDATTFNSSSATLTIPAGGTVLYALLVWGGKVGAAAAPNADPALRGAARLTLPDGTVVPVSTTQVDERASDHAYQAALDVTDTVAAGGSGVYTMANVQSSSGGTDQYAGWSLVVAVSDPSAPARNLTVFTGYGVVANGDPLPTFTVSGFLTPPSGPVHTTLGAVTWEGDLGYNGDTFRLDSYDVTDARNPADNVFNSSITVDGVDAAGRNPSYANNLGMDADLYTIPESSSLPNGATSADITLTTTSETYYPGVVTFATDLYDPKLLGNKTVAEVGDTSGGTILPGDTLRYTVPVENIGLDTASGSTFFDAIPTGTTYVPGSLTVDGAPMTDAAGDDLGEYGVSGGNGHVVAYLGAGATATSGGDIPVTSGSTQHTVVFDVTVDATVTDGQKLVNAAALTYQGLTTRASSSSATNAVISPVVGTAPVPGNEPPVAAPHILSFTPAPGARDVDIAVLDGASDPDDPVASLHVVAVTDPAGGTVTVNPDGTVTYAPRDDVAGRDVFTYTIEDPAGNRMTAMVQVEVSNTAPDAVDDAVTLPANQASTVDVLTNDTDANGDALAVRSVSAASAQGGTATLVGGVVTYTPPTGFRGTDTFTYVVEDSRGGTDTATVTVTVANNPPVATDDPYGTTVAAPVAVAVLGNDSDLDGDTLTAAVASGPSHGTVSLAADGTGTYTPTAGYTGTDSFTYTVSDGHGGTDTATVTITVNGAPVAADDSAGTPGGTAATVTVLTNDSDPNDDTLTVTSATDPTHGSAVVNADGSITYTPDAGWAGPDTFDYTLSDGSLTDSATVTVTVANQDPVAVDDTGSTPVNTALVGVDVLSNDSDPNVTAGVPGQALSVTAASADHGAAVTVAGDGTLSVTPAAGYSGPVTVTYTVSDGVGGTATGTLVVTVANGVPSAAADSASTSTDTSVLVDVLANDTDPNPADTLALVPASLTDPQDSGATTRGSVAIEGGEVRYTPPAGFAGQVAFDYTVTDGTATATATVTVTVANAAPTAVDDATTTPTDTPVTTDVLGNDTDPNIPGTAQALAVMAAGADHGASVALEPDGSLTVTPAAGFAGDVTVTYTVADGAGGTDTGTLTVTVLDAAPVAVHDAVSTPYLTTVDVPVLANDTDANGDPLSVVGGSLGTPKDAHGAVRGTVTVSGDVVTYTPPAGFSGPVTFTYRVTDGVATSTATVTVVVGNAPPVASDDVVSVVGDQPIRIRVVDNDSDPDGGTLTLAAVTQPARGGTVAIVDDGLVVTPDPGYSGTLSFSYTLADEVGGTSTATVTVQVSAATAAPGSLAATGTDPRGLLALAAGLVLAGVALMAARWRSRRV